MFTGIPRAQFFPVRHIDLPKVFPVSSQDFPPQHFFPKPVRDASDEVINMTSYTSVTPSPERSNWESPTPEVNNCASSGEANDNLDSPNGHYADDDSDDALPSPSQRPLKKPELSFSIERILGWGSSKDPKRSSDSKKANQISHLPQSLCVGRYGDVGNDDDEEDEDDDEVIDDTVDVDDSSPKSVSMRGAYPQPCDTDTPNYQWLQCTRYHPPKLQSKYIFLR